MKSKRSRIALRSHNCYELEFPISTYRCYPITAEQTPRIALGQLLYWHDLRKEQRIISNQIQDGGSVMVWVAIFFSMDSIAHFSRWMANSLSIRYVQWIYYLLQNFQLVDDIGYFSKIMLRYKRRESQTWFNSEQIKVLRGQLVVLL